MFLFDNRDKKRNYKKLIMMCLFWNSKRIYNNVSNKLPDSPLMISVCQQLCASSFYWKKQLFRQKYEVSEQLVL